MTRIIAGSARGRRIAVPPGRTVRPTADRCREGLFSSLASLVGDLEGLRFLDLYAGSGAVGLEALSRGVAHSLLVESDPAVARVLTSNVATLGLGAEVQIGAVERLVSQPAPSAYDIVFADPPYLLGDDELREVFEACLRHGWVAPGAVVVVERATRGEPWRWPVGLAAERSRTYGEATLWYGRAAEPAGPVPPEEG